ncbi:uncharacterized protein WCC33_009372 [Rhinophrynus dorsalis]
MHQLTIVFVSPNRESSCCWITNSNSMGSWSLQTFVDLGTRSDTSKPNNSPVTTIIPVIRVPSNCPSSFKLLAHDPDGDIVRCRYGKQNSGECATCYRPPEFTLDQDAIWNACYIYGGLSWWWYDEQFRQRMAIWPSMSFDQLDIGLWLAIMMHLVTFQCGMAWFQKESGKFRMIHHLSYPFGDLLNAHIDKDTSWVTYASFDRVVELVVLAGHGALLTFSMFLEWVVKAESGFASIIHFFDDFLCAGPGGSVLTFSLAFFGVMRIGKLVSKSKAQPGAIMWEEVDLESGRLRFRIPHSKTDVFGHRLELSPLEYGGHLFRIGMEVARLGLPDAGVMSPCIFGHSFVYWAHCRALVRKNGLQLVFAASEVENSCILSFSSSLPVYTYVFELVVEDFPNQNISLTYNDGTVDYRYKPIATSAETETSATGYPYWTTAWKASPSYAPPMSALSKIPLQFLLEVTSAAPTCTYGEYRPKFLPPTPNEGEKVMARAGSPLQIHLTAQATYNSITDFKVSGPSQLSKVFTSSSGTSTRSMLVQWTPSENDVGDRVPFCFVAETVNGYQSELRCIIAVVRPSKLANATLICNENTMTLFIAKSPGDDNGWLLGDPQCLVTSNSTHHIASVAYNSCGTKTEETEDYIVFKNRVTSFHNTTDVITRKHHLAISFNCSFSKNILLSNAFHPQKAAYEFENFTYKFQFYTDEQFRDIQTQYPLEVWLRDKLYMEIQVTSTVSNVELFVESCRATPHGDPNYPIFYDIIQDGCLKDETVVVYPGTQTRARFGMEAFAFIGNYEEVYLNCTVILCKLGEPNTRCTLGCTNSSLLNANQLGSRSLFESQQYFISQGPLRMMKQSVSTGSNKSQSLNVNTMIVALFGVAIVALTLWVPGVSSEFLEELITVSHVRTDVVVSDGLAVFD